MKLTNTAILGLILFITTVSALATGVSEQLNPDLSTTKRELLHSQEKSYGNVELEGREAQDTEARQATTSDLQSFQSGSKRELIHRSSNDAHGFVAQEDVYCCPVPGQNWGFAPTTPIMWGISYLNGLNPGVCNVDARSCVRVSCSWDAAIYLCNDNFNEISPPCSTIAEYAEVLVDVCSNHYALINYYSTCGQLFDSSGTYNVIVRSESC